MNLTNQKYNLGFNLGTLSCKYYTNLRGFNGMEKDNEFVSNTGDVYTTYYRALDVRIGRWFSVDPAIQSWQSPYNSMDCNPLFYVDPLGDKVKYEKVRDWVNSSFKWLTSKNYREKFRSWNSETYDVTLKKRKGSEALNNAYQKVGSSNPLGSIYCLPEGTVGEVLYDNKLGINLDINIDLRGQKRVTEPFKILDGIKPDGTFKGKPHSITQTKILENLVPGKTVLMYADRYPDYFEIKDNKGNVIMPKKSVVDYGNTYYDPSNPNNKVQQGFLKYVVKDTDISLYVTMSSIYNWPKGPNKTPSIGFVTYYKYRYPSLNFSIKINL